MGIRSLSLPLPAEPARDVAADDDLELALDPVRLHDALRRNWVESQNYPLEGSLTPVSGKEFLPSAIVGLFEASAAAQEGWHLVSSAQVSESFY